MSSELPDVWLPTYTHVPLLTPQECARIIAASPRENLKAATRVSNDDPYQFVVDEDYRVALTCKYVPGDPIYELLLSRVMRNLPKINEAFQFRLHEDPHRLLPAIMINRYDGGAKPGHHSWHVDAGGHHLTRERKLSIVITLSAPGTYGGGQLQLLDGSCEFPLAEVQEGVGAVFHSLMLHRVLPVTGIGERYSCVLWLMGPRFE